MAEFTGLLKAFGWMRELDLPEGRWIFCRAIPGTGWWDVDDALGTVPGALRCGRTLLDRTWVAVPEQSWGELAVMRAQSNHRTHVRGVVTR